MNSNAWAIIIGVLCGLAAGIPTAILTIIALVRIHAAKVPPLQIGRRPLLDVPVDEILKCYALTTSYDPRGELWPAPTDSGEAGDGS